MGNADAARFKGKGRGDEIAFVGDGQARAAKFLGIDGSVIFSGEVARDVAGSVKNLVAVGGGGIADIAAIATTVANNLNKKTDEPADKAGSAGGRS